MLRIMKFLFLDLLSVSAAFYFALFFCFGGSVPFLYLSHLYIYIMLGFALSALLMALAHAYATEIILFNLTDATRMGACLMGGYAVLWLINRVLAAPLPLLVLINYICLNTLLMGVARLLMRMWAWFHKRILISPYRGGHVKNILIFGAGGAGQYLLNMLMYTPKERCRIVGFIDDDPRLWGRSIKNVPVMGSREHIPKIAQQYHIDEIIIAIPHVDNSTIREIFKYCTQANCATRRFANMSNFTGESLSKATIDEIRLEDLLGRSEVRLNMQPVQELISGKTVLVTGGAGSIGSEICRQSLKLGARTIIIFDFDENGLFTIGYELSKTYAKHKFHTVLGSVRDSSRLDEVFSGYRPDIVFHAAAHKHVPMMEINPYEALTNNVVGTYNAAITAMRYDVQKFILISTDKAVNPSNIMGASKRIAELLIQSMNRHDGGSRTVFSAVRFGNVLGSNGSVIPLFKRQISEGGPVTVTDRNITRYFMTIPEAVQLVLEASSMAKGHEIFVLNMGEPVRIYDLACTMIRLAGLTPEKDVPIQITGLRDGEKLYEEISLNTECIEETENNRIFILKTDPVKHRVTENALTELFSAVSNRQDEQVSSIIKSLVPTFESELFRPYEPAGLSAVVQNVPILPLRQPNMASFQKHTGA
ncbi:MAG TPA: nucleoside-diphosphate sugar epimerase/dehydratase, partial [Feifaniaceae bacterium]|nr:nucleoside-diphosphate sugar epimerase/dehydratase [Feifaniaceae bacterium]